MKVSIATLKVERRPVGISDDCVLGKFGGDGSSRKCDATVDAL